MAVRQHQSQGVWFDVAASFCWRMLWSGVTIILAFTHEDRWFWNYRPEGAPIYDGHPRTGKNCGRGKEAERTFCGVWSRTKPNSTHFGQVAECSADSVRKPKLETWSENRRDDTPGSGGSKKNNSNPSNSVPSDWTNSTQASNHRSNNENKGRQNQGNDSPRQGRNNNQNFEQNRNWQSSLVDSQYQEPFQDQRQGTLVSLLEWLPPMQQPTTSRSSWLPAPRPWYF